MRHGILLVAFILGGFLTVALAREFYWLMEAFAAIGIIGVFGGATWLTAKHWDRANEIKQQEQLERMRAEQPPRPPGFFD